MEAIALSRDIPAALRLFVEPIVRRVSRSSVATSLQQTEAAVRSHSGGEVALAKGQDQNRARVSVTLARDRCVTSRK